MGVRLPFAMGRAILKEKVVICDHGFAASGNDNAHIGAVLRDMGYGVAYVSRTYDGGFLELNWIRGISPAVIVADPSLHVKGKRYIDIPFIAGLKGICAETGARLLLYALSPEKLGEGGILDKGDHPSIVKIVEEAHSEYVRALIS